MALYATYQATGKEVTPDGKGVANVMSIIEVHVTQAGFFCDAAILGTSRVFDYQDARDAVHRFVREAEWYLVRLHEIDPE